MLVDHKIKILRVDNTDMEANHSIIDMEGSESYIGEPVGHVSVKMPQFATSNVSLFFKRVEAQFHIANVKNVRTKYFHVISVLPDAIGDIIQTQPMHSDPYELLKTELLNMCEKSKQAKMDDAFSTLDVSDEKPSILIRRVTKIFTDAGIAPTDEIVIHKSLQALPNSLRNLLLVHTSEPVDRFQRLADTVWAAHQTYKVTAVTTKNTNYAGSSPNAMARSSSPICPSTTSSTLPDLRPFRAGQRPRICRAHIYYGKDAKTCRPYCEFPSEKPKLPYKIHTPTQSRPNSPMSEN